MKTLSLALPYFPINLAGLLGIFMLSYVFISVICKDIKSVDLISKILLSLIIYLKDVYQNSVNDFLTDEIIKSNNEMLELKLELRNKLQK